jgi:hypothetical protein
LRELLAVLPVGVGMSLRNAVAVIEGLVDEGGHFQRTPKAGNSTLREVTRRFPIAELAFSLFFLATLASFSLAGHWAALPFLALFFSGYGYVSLKSMV